jgi:hypothetical protein
VAEVGESEFETSLNYVVGDCCKRKKVQKTPTKFKIKKSSFLLEVSILSCLWERAVRIHRTGF